MNNFKTLGLLLALLSAPALALETDSKLGKKIYTTCSACHLADGKGVVGAFPPIANRLNDIAVDSLGREYLISVVLLGLKGSIKADGKSYYGVMQGFSANFSDEEISAVLNYVIVDLSTKKPEKFESFSALEVKKLRDLKDEKKLASSHTQRKQLDID
jgi:cytochrome c553